MAAVNESDVTVRQKLPFSEICGYNFVLSKKDASMRRGTSASRGQRLSGLGGVALAIRGGSKRRRAAKLFAGQSPA
jgi:hypothetical protein